MLIEREKFLQNVARDTVRVLFPEDRILNFVINRYGIYMPDIARNIRPYPPEHQRDFFMAILGAQGANIAHADRLAAFLVYLNGLNYDAIVNESQLRQGIRREAAINVDIDEVFEQIPVALVHLTRRYEGFNLARKFGGDIADEVCLFSEGRNGNRLPFATARNFTRDATNYAGAIVVSDLL